MRYGAITILFFFLFFSFIYCNAQPDNNYIFRHIDQSDGLLHNRIYSLAQDGKGYIWILSPNGLQRYDGSRFVNYPYDPNNPGGITYKQDCGLFADKKNDKLWIVHENIAQLDLQKNKFTYYNSEQLKKDTSFRFETYKDSVGHSWFAGNFGMFDSDPAKISVHYLTASFLNPGNSNPFFIDQQNEQVWMPLWSYGLLLLDKKTKKIYSKNYNPIHHPLLQLLDKNLLFYFFKDSNKNLWITSSLPEFYKYDPSTQKITTYSLSATIQEKSNVTDATMFVHCIFEDNHHNIWVGTQNAGLLKYNKEADHFISITGRDEKQPGIKYNYDINCIIQDKDDNLWLGTDKGITIFNPYRQYFQSVHHDEKDPNSLPKNEIQECIETKNGNILVATWGGGFTVFDNQWHFKKNIRFDNEPSEYNLLWSFIQNDDGTTWIGCQHGYIHIYDPVKETVTTIHPPELNKFTIHCMAKDKYGNILFGLHNGKIAKWNKAENKFYAYNDRFTGIQQTLTPVLNMYIDDQQHCWVGTESGLKEFDMDKMVYISVYIPGKKDRNSISSNQVQSIDYYDDSSLVIGTVYGGIDFFNKKTKTFSILTADKSGLPSNTINNVKKDKHDDLWFTTEYDLYKYTRSENKFIHYNIEPGIINATFKSGHFYCLKDGRWIANTETEILCFNPDSLQKQEISGLPVNITGFKILNKDIFIDSLLYANKPVELSHEQNFISIEYGALNFSGLQETKYYYQLEGVNKDWVYAGSQRFANYTNLDPGEYTFNVKAGNKTTDHITSFQIIITPPFWQTTWFRLIVILLVVVFTYLLFKKRVNAIRHEAELKQLIAETEMMALRAQMNPHFIFNCINSIDALIQSNDKYQATVYLNKFAKLIRNILDSSKQNVVTLSKDMETLQLYIDLEKFRNENKFTVEINADKTLLQDDYKVPPLIIQPYVENAILHGLKNRMDNNGKLLISAGRQNGRIQFIIEDNGVGRQPRANTKQDDKRSYGMQMSSDRVKLFNKEDTASVFITDLEKDGKQAGTKVEVFLNI